MAGKFIEARRGKIYYDGSEVLCITINIDSTPAVIEENPDFYLKVVKPDGTETEWQIDQREYNRLVMLGVEVK